MPLTPGTRLGPYEILAPLGAGGMGEVYRAKDTKLDREVAIKVLPVAFAQDRERLTRFEREAKVLASLNHPNIAQIYGLEANALVMELVAGSTLSVPQPIATALHYARQIAEALEAAHEKGITHRDLKPANIMITPDGVVKVLDFGLASVPSREASSDPAHSPTLTMAATQAGVIMGTASYMSPEQASGKVADKRSDIWSFGVVLWEMLTGEKLFSGETNAHTMADVLHESIDFAKLPPATPAPLSLLLKRCLVRDLKSRLRDIGEARIAIDSYLAAPAAAAPVPSHPQPRATTKWAWALAGVLACVAAAALWALFRPAGPGQPLVTVDLDLGSELSLDSSVGPAAILSPDGSRLAFVAFGPDGTRRLFTRRLNQPKALALPTTEGAYAPFFSPDGQWLGFFARGKLNKIRLDSGVTIPLCDAPNGRGATWNEDDTIIAALDTRGALSQLPADGGMPVFITKLEGQEIGHRWPQVLPGGKAVLFMANTTPANYSESTIAAVSLADHRRKVLLDRGGMYPRYLSAGYLAYVKKGKLFAVGFDPERLAIRGSAASLLDEFISDVTFGSAQFDVSSQGAMVFRKGKASGLRLIQWIDAAGKMESLVAEPALYQMPRLSPDGSRLAFSVTDGAASDIWVYDARQGGRARITAGAGVKSFPVWSPDGRYLVYNSAGGMFSVRSDGAGSPAPFNTGIQQIPASFSPDGARLAFYERNATGGSVIYTLSVRITPSGLEAGKPELFLQTAASAPNPVFSPDGHWLAYASADSGTYEVYVRSFPDRGTQRQISNSGGGMPSWSRNGRELFYRTEDQRIMAVDYEVKGETFVTGKPRVWHAGGQLANTGNTPNLDLSPDGKRFAIVTPVDGPEPRETRSHVMLVLNFFDEVRRRVR